MKNNNKRGIVTSMSLIFKALIFLSITNSVASAQSCIYPWSIEAGLGVSEYAGKMGNGFYHFDLAAHKMYPDEVDNNTTNSPGIGYIAITKSANLNLDLSLRMYHGEWGYYQKAAPNFHFYHSVTAFEFLPRWKLFGNFNRFFVPYVAAGLGIRTIKMYGSTAYGLFGKDKDHIYEMNFPMGLGASVRITPRLSLNLQSTFVFTTHGISTSPATTNDKVMNQTIGLMFSLGEPMACQSGKPLLCPPFRRR